MRFLLFILLLTTFLSRCNSMFETKELGSESSNIAKSLVIIFAKRPKNPSKPIQLCPGVIINETKIITAGHCFDRGQKVMVIYGNMGEEMKSNLTLDSVVDWGLFPKMIEPNKLIKWAKFHPSKEFKESPYIRKKGIVKLHWLIKETLVKQGLPSTKILLLIVHPYCVSIYCKILTDNGLSSSR